APRPSGRSDTGGARVRHLCPELRARPAFHTRGHGGGRRKNPAGLSGPRPCGAFPDEVLRCAPSIQRPDAGRGIRMAGKVGRRLCALIPVLLATTASGAAPASRTFIFTNSSRDLGEFRAFAKIASRLKPHGSVQIDIGVLASTAMFEMPPAWSAWHEYAIFNANLSKFFPHPQIAPYLPADWVTKNRELLMAKAAILRELGLEAALSSN